MIVWGFNLGVWFSLFRPGWIFNHFCSGIWIFSRFITIWRTFDHFIFELNKLVLCCLDLCTIIFVAPTQSTLHDCAHLVILFTSTYDNQCLSPRKFWVLFPKMEKCNGYNLMWSSLSVTYDKFEVFLWVLWFPPP